MRYTVLVRTSPAGATVHVLLDDESLDGGDGVRYRIVCSTDDAEEAERAAALMRDRILSGELRVGQGGKPRISEERATPGARDDLLSY